METMNIWIEYRGIIDEKEVDIILKVNETENKAMVKENGIPVGEKKKVDRYVLKAIDEMKKTGIIKKMIKSIKL